MADLICAKAAIDDPEHRCGDDPCTMVGVQGKFPPENLRLSVQHLREALCAAENFARDCLTDAARSGVSLVPYTEQYLRVTDALGSVDSLPLPPPKAA